MEDCLHGTSSEPRRTTAEDRSGADARGRRGGRAGMAPGGTRTRPQPPHPRHGHVRATPSHAPHGASLAREQHLHGSRVRSCAPSCGGTVH